jgi:hypothetical protein
VTRNILLVVNIISILLCAAGFVLNLGWNRCIFGIVLVPTLIVHSIIHFSLTRKRVKAKTVLYSCLSNLALILTFVLLPDGADSPETYAVFGLYKNPPEFFLTIAQVSFICSIVLTVMANRSERVS